MRRHAEIFDLVQALFDKTGFNDHQLHGMIRFNGRVDAAALKGAFRLLLETVPALSRVYRDHGGASYWEDAPTTDYHALFTVTDSAAEFDSFICSKTNPEHGPQIKGCLFRGETDALSIVANHMVMDGAGFKECLYLLSQLYSARVRDPAYRPDFVLDGDRSVGKILSGLGLKDRLTILIKKSGDNNASGAYAFPFPGGDAAPFILTYALTPALSGDIVVCGKAHGATVNDVILAAYFRVLSAELRLNGAPLSLPLMIDMRRYLEDKCFHALSNIASTENVTVAVQPGEAFSDTLERIANLTKAKKTEYFGLNSFVKLGALFALFGRRLAYRLLEGGLHNPNICVTNIGVIDDKRLVFQGVKIDDAIVTGSIKYRPHFQMSLSSYQDTLTLAVNMYGSNEDRAKIGEFFDAMECALQAAAQGR